MIKFVCPITCAGDFLLVKFPMEKPLENSFTYSKSIIYIYIMFYRRKVILALLQTFEGKLSTLDLHQLLFLIVERQQKKVYDFVPHPSGCFSFSLEADLDTMQHKKMLSLVNEKWQKTDAEDYFKMLIRDDQQLVLDIQNQYAEMDTETLTKYVFIHFPYWALKSETAASLLDKDQLEKVNNSINPENKVTLFTIGYEGISPEEYLNRLIQNDVKMLVDVRRNPLSMKYGFSKSLLKKFCESLGIMYIHFPEAGIEADQRQELKTPADYDKLFEKYKTNYLPKIKDQQLEILSLLKQHERIALTCFEADVCQCHRKHLAESIAADPGFGYVLRHI